MEDLIFYSVFEEGKDKPAFFTGESNRAEAFYIVMAELEKRVVLNKHMFRCLTTTPMMRSDPAGVTDAMDE